MHYRITGLDAARFSALRDLSDAALKRIGAERCRVTEAHSAPCRVSLRDAEIGETVILTSFEHQPASSPYRAAGPVFVREAARDVAVFRNAVPECVARRLLSVRAYDRRDCIHDAEVVDGTALVDSIRRHLADPAIAYLHIHYARRGCYACRVDRD